MFVEFFEKVMDRKLHIFFLLAIFLNLAEASVLKCGPHAVKNTPEYSKNVEFDIENGVLKGKHFQNKKIGNVKWQLESKGDVSQFTGTFEKGKAKISVTQDKVDKKLFLGNLLNPAGKSVRTCSLLLSDADLNKVNCINDPTSCEKISRNKLQLVNANKPLIAKIINHSNGGSLPSVKKENTDTVKKKVNDANGAEIIVSVKEFSKTFAKEKSVGNRIDRRWNILSFVKTLDGSQSLYDADNNAYDEISGCLSLDENQFNADEFEELRKRILPSVLGKLFKEYGRTKPIKLSLDKGDCRSVKTQCRDSRGIAIRGWCEGKSNNISLQGYHLIVAQKGIMESLKSNEDIFTLNEVKRFDKQKVSDWLVKAKEIKENEGQTKAENLDRFKKLSQSKSEDEIASITLSYPSRKSGMSVCSRSDTDFFYIVSNGYLVSSKDEKSKVSEGFREAYVEANIKLNPKEIVSKRFEDLDAFYAEYQLNPNVCQVFVDYPHNLKKLMSVLNNGEAIEVNTLVPIAKAKEKWAKAQGFSNYSQYEFSVKINADVRDVNALSELGVHGLNSYEKAFERMVKTSYSNKSNSTMLIAFLEDEKTGKQINKTAVEVRDDRENKAAEELAEFTKKYPYYAVVSCGFAGGHTNIVPCFYSKDFGNTEFQLIINGVEESYSSYQVQNLGREQYDGNYLDLPPNFSIIAQNAHDRFTLSVKLYDRASGRLLEQKQAGTLYGTIILTH